MSRFFLYFVNINKYVPYTRIKFLKIFWNNSCNLDKNLVEYMLGEFLEFFKQKLSLSLFPID